MYQSRGRDWTLKCSFSPARFGLVVLFWVISPKVEDLSWLRTYSRENHHINLLPHFKMATLKPLSKSSWLHLALESYCNLNALKFGWHPSNVYCLVKDGLFCSSYLVVFIARSNWKVSHPRYSNINIQQNTTPNHPPNFRYPKIHTYLYKPIK